MTSTNYGIDDSNGDSLTQGLPEHMARATAQRMANDRGETVYLYPMGVEGAKSVAIEPIVIVETMPDHLRDSHRAAGNWGAYPHNGAERESMSRAEADEVVEGDLDGYARIVE